MKVSVWYRYAPLESCLVWALYNVPIPTQVYLSGGDSATKLSTFLLGENHDDMAKTQNETLQSEVHSAFQ